MSVLTKAPDWWGRSDHPLSYLLAPLGLVYSLGVRLRFALTTPYHSSLPVICIGNFTVGGGGKTPLAAEIADLLAETGYKPVFLTRGYGGRTKGPHLVDLAMDSAVDVGDEPLILAQTAPVIVCADRGKGARFIERMDADLIIMDDGFQNPGLHQDLSLVVVDAAVGVGNGHVFPAGPLRADLSFQLPRTDILVMAGSIETQAGGAAIEIEQRFSGLVLRSAIMAVGDVSWLTDGAISTVTGIARPDKFYESLEKLGARIVKKSEFPDHHCFTEQEAADILAAAQIDETPIVMTQKDWVRLPQSGERGRLREAARILYIKAKINEPQKLLSRLKQAIDKA